MLWVKRNPSIEELYRDAEQKQSIKTINNGAMVAYSGEDILFPNKNWSDEGEYWKRLTDLIKLFDEKYKKIINL